MSDLLAQVYSYLHGIWSYRWSALVVAWIVSILGWTVVYFLPNQYMSTAVVHIDSGSLIQPLLEGLAVGTSVDKEIDVLRRRLLSEKNLESIVRQTDLRSRAVDDDAMSRLTTDLAQALTFTEEQSSREDKKNKKAKKAIYTISLEGRSPQLVHQIVSKTLDSLVESTLKSARTDTTSEQKFLNEQIAEYEKRLSKSERDLAKFTAANIGLMPDETGGYYNRLQREQEALAAMRAELRSEEQRLLEMRKQLKGELPIHSGQQLSKVKAYRDQLQDLLTQYTESHPDVQALKTLIAEILAEKNTESTYLSAEDMEFNPTYQELKVETRNVGIEVEAIRAKIIEQKAKVENLQASVDFIPEIEAELAKLNRDYDLTSKRYLGLVERRESVRLAEAVGQSGHNVNIKILAEPYVAEEPSGPNRLMLMSIVFGVALIAGLAWGGIKYLLHPTFIYLRQLDYLEIPVLGTVGLFMTDEHKKKRRIQLTSFLMVFSLLLVAYGTNVYLELDITIEDILIIFQSSDI